MKRRQDCWMLKIFDLRNFINEGLNTAVKLLNNDLPTLTIGQPAFSPTLIIFSFRYGVG